MQVVRYLISCYQQETKQTDKLADIEALIQELLSRSHGDTVPEKFKVSNRAGLELIPKNNL